jgi:hypothetical protein
MSGGTTKSKEVSVTPKGWARLDELQASRPRFDRVFVAMWFDPLMADAYN